MTTRTRLLGVDFGTKRIGLAVSDPDRRLASPLANYQRQNPDRDTRHFQRLLEAEGISGIILGLPVHLSGQEGQKSTEARVFGNWLQQFTSLPIIYWDERFTTADAEQLMIDAGLTSKQRKARRDMVAAQILLQTYLDAGCPAASEIKPLLDK